MKVCPVCKSRCFDDMQVCYGCMHQFNSPKIAEEDLPKVMHTVEKDPIPAFFEIEEYPIVEDIETFMLRQTDDSANLWEYEMPNAREPKKQQGKILKDCTLEIKSATVKLNENSISINFKI